MQTNVSSVSSSALVLVQQVSQLKKAGKQER